LIGSNSSSSSFLVITTKSNYEKALKKATELHAMRLAFDYLSKEGYTSKDVSNQKNIGYDIHANKGENMLGVEVKGSINRADFINVTSSEVEYTEGVSENNYQSLLFVVDNIQVIKNGEIYAPTIPRIESSSNTLPTNNPSFYNDFNLYLLRQGAFGSSYIPPIYNNFETFTLTSYGIQRFFYRGHRH
jgi:hypothetical protein